MADHPLMKNLQHDELLFSFVVDDAVTRVSNRFLVDQLTVSTMRHDVKARYKTLFRWLEKFQRLALKNGYARIGDKRKYVDGLKSSNIAKRKKALEHVVRWSVQS